jgi:predicted ATP-grasp superfamily ATP-dependent carboligase
MGMTPTTIDLFADLDLREVARATRIDRDEYPQGLQGRLADAPDGPWMYVGALENQPDLIRRIASNRPLWGASRDALERVKSPERIQAWMLDAGLLPVETREAPPRNSRGSWLVKPLASGGGREIQLWTGTVADFGEPVYFQQLVEGVAASAVFLGDGTTATFLGATEQWIGTAAGPYEYVGSIGPIGISPARRDQIDRMGRAVVERSGLAGLFGIDLVLNEDRVWLIEVNPRYTASVEVLEWSQGRSFLGLHRRVFDATRPDAPCWKPLPGILGKAILRATADCTFPARLSDRRLENVARRFPTIADVPDPGTRIGRGEPVMTVFARGGTVQECRRRLQGRLASWTRRLTTGS